MPVSSFACFIDRRSRFHHTPLTQYSEAGWFKKNLKFTASLRDTSSLVLAKSTERFFVLFPTALIHLVACQQHADKYALPALRIPVPVSTVCPHCRECHLGIMRHMMSRYWLGPGHVPGLSASSSMHHYAHLIGVVLPVLMSAHTSVTLFLSARERQTVLIPTFSSAEPDAWA